MSEVIIRDKTEYHARTSEQMERHLPLPPWSLRQKMALTCRILADEGHESALAGQITARGDRPGTCWMLSFGLGFDEARASNIVLVDDDLNLIEGDGMVNPSNRFHLWIYRHRPDVTAIVHTHPPYCSALSVTGQPLVAAHMDTAMFYDDCAYLAEWPGPPIGARAIDREGQADRSGHRPRGARLSAQAARGCCDVPLLCSACAQGGARRAGLAGTSIMQLSDRLDAHRLPPLCSIAATAPSDGSQFDEPAIAFGPKRTCTVVGLRPPRSRMTQSGHRPEQNPAAQQPPAVPCYAPLKPDQVPNLPGDSAHNTRCMTLNVRKGKFLCGLA